MFCHRLEPGLEILPAPLLEFPPRGIGSHPRQEAAQFRHVGADQRLEDGAPQTEARVAQVEPRGVIGGRRLLRDIGAHPRDLWSVAMPTEDGLHHLGRGVTIGNLDQPTIDHSGARSQPGLEPAEKGVHQDVGRRIPLGVGVFGHEGRALRIDPKPDQVLENGPLIRHLGRLNEDLLAVRRVDDQQGTAVLALVRHRDVGGHERPPAVRARELNLELPHRYGLGWMGSFSGRHLDARWSGLLNYGRAL